MTIHAPVPVAAVPNERGAVRRRPRAFWPLVGSIAVLSLGGFVGGVSFVADRTGAGLGADPSWLAETPVADFLVPGLLLLGVDGIGGLALIVGLIWRRPEWHVGKHHWSWVGSIAVGAMLVAWIGYEFVVLPATTILQPILIGVGIAMIGIPLLPAMRAHDAGPQRDGRRSRSLDAGWGGAA